MYAIVSLMVLHVQCGLSEFKVLERKLKAAGKPGSDKWMVTMARQLGLSAKDLQADFGSVDPQLAKNDAFRDALKEFKTATQPSIKMLNDMNEKVNKELESAMIKSAHKKRATTRKLAAEDKKEEAAGDKKDKIKDDHEEEHHDQDEVLPDEENEDDLPEKSSKDGKSPVKTIIQRLKDRVRLINQKVNHLMFHNHHDLGGVTAHYSPSGMQLIPNYEGDSLDTKLKAVDYMNQMRSYNPTLHTILPYYINDHVGSSGRKLVNNGKGQAV